MNPSHTYRAVRIGDVADWRLICYISASGMSAWLRHSDPSEPVVPILEEKWEVKEEEGLLKRIEECVYDHPQVLDDFSADIILEASKKLWVPTERVADDEEQGEDWYADVFEADPMDIMAEEVGDATALFSLAPGLKAFLQRTFPGARLHSHVAVEVGKLRNRNADAQRIYIDIREGEADFLMFRGTEFISASTHMWSELSDIQYHLYNIMDIYGADARTVQVAVSGLSEAKAALLPLLRKQIAYVTLTTIPNIEGANGGLPLSVALVMKGEIQV